ncbi:MAG: hypothetical protein EOO45_23445 [Flavobacterium sp.]|nr:MAG: hypothetical protein EOO45_23445 [Flavobacterium sp.]
MRNTYFILSALIVSVFVLTSVGKPTEVSILKPKSENSIVSDTLSWKLLGQIKYVKKPSKDYPEGVMFPVVNASLKAKNKKSIIMSGFIIPIDNKNYALSKNVFASCFFCGQAGPETIMGIKFKNGDMKLKTDQYVTLQGTFRSNETDVDDWIYHIENAVIIKGH